MYSVQYYNLDVTTSVTGTTQVFIGQNDSVMLFIPALATWAGSSVVEMRLMGAYQSGVSGRTMYYYDYVNQTPKECVVTITTGGNYEIPNAGGGAPFVRIEFGNAATKATNGIFLTTSKITY